MLPCIDWDYDAKTRTKTFASSKLTQASREREPIKEKVNEKTATTNTGSCSNGTERNVHSSS